MKPARKLIVVALLIGMGAAIGAVAGTTAAVVQKGQKVNVPSETLLEFRLQQPASLPARK
jgi:hypothetical protein